MQHSALDDGSSIHWLLLFEMRLRLVLQAMVTRSITNMSFSSLLQMAVDAIC